MRLYTLRDEVPEQQVDSFKQAKAYMKATSIKDEVAIFALEDNTMYRYFIGLDGRVYTPKSLRRFHRGNDLFHLALAVTPWVMVFIYTFTQSERPVWWVALLLALALTVTAFILIVERTRRKILAKLLEELVADTIKQADPQLRAKGLRPLEPSVIGGS